MAAKPHASPEPELDPHGIEDRLIDRFAAGDETLIALVLARP